jgi:hypothetical protein
MKKLTDKQLVAFIRGMLHYPTPSEPRLNMEMGTLEIAKGLHLLAKEIEDGI